MQTYLRLKEKINNYRTGGSLYSDPESKPKNKYRDDLAPATGKKIKPDIGYNKPSINTDKLMLEIDKYINGKKQ